MTRRPPRRRSVRSPWRQRLAVVPRWGWAVLLIALIGVVYLVVRHRQPDEQSPAVVSNRALLLNDASAALRGDPSIADVVYNSAADQWDVTPADADADPLTFGRYVCFMLDQNGVGAATTNVRVIDDARLQASGFDYQAASRGVIRCGSER